MGGIVLSVVLGCAKPFSNRRNKNSTVVDGKKEIRGNKKSTKQKKEPG
jgi:hypothetical protein